MPDFRGVVNGAVIDLGTSVTLRSYTNGTFNSYGDMSETLGTTTITAVVQILRQEDELVKEGHLFTGDAVFYVNQAEGATINRGDQIYYGSVGYAVTNIVPYEMSGNVQVYEIRTNKEA